MAEIELLPCPFCGGEAYLAKVGLPPYKYFVDCNDCECILGLTECFLTKEEAAAAWNRRYWGNEIMRMGDRVFVEGLGMFERVKE